MSRLCSKSAAGAAPTEAGLALGGFAIGGLIYSAAGELDAASASACGRMLIGGGLFAALALLVHRARAATGSSTPPP